MSQPFLTIGIPTWNRCTYLKNNLLALLAQMQKYQITNIEILIADNASTDATASMCQTLTTQHSFLTYHRHAHNRGANANFQYVIETARGEYVWLLGDDDLLANDVMLKVMNDIQQNNPDAVLGPAIYDQSQEKATHQAYHQLLLTNREVLTQDDVISLAGKISGLIFKKSSVLPAMIKMTPLIHATRTPWPHLAWLLVLLNDPQKKLLILPYGTNQLVAENWHNLLFNGKTLLKILVLDYQTLILALKSSLDPPFFQGLLMRSIATRTGTLLKCVLYGSYLDGYWELLLKALQGWPRVVGTKNKFYYFAFLILPLIIPISLRKVGCQLARLRWNKMDMTIARIQQAKVMLRQQATIDCREFNEQEL